MKGWHFFGTNQSLQLLEKEVSAVKKGYVLIKVKAAGICHSDVGVLNDKKWMKNIQYTPIIMGHEIAGVIIEVGEGVSGFEVGDRVGVCPVSKLGKSPGYGYDGGFAEYVSAPAIDLVRIPPNVTFKQAAVGTDAGMTSYHALFARGGAKIDMKIGIIGIGGLGENAARMAVIKGCDVYAVDIDPAARELAISLGVKEVYESTAQLTPHKCDLIVDFAGFGTTTEDAIEAVKKQGTVVLVGMGKLEATMSTSSIILKEISLKGSNGGTVEDIEAVYSLYASGQLNPTITEISFQQIPEGLDRLARNKVKGRLVAAID